MLAAPFAHTCLDNDMRLQQGGHTGWHAAVQRRWKQQPQGSQPQCSALLRTRPPSTPTQGEGSGAAGRGSTKLPLQKRQELLQQQAQAPLKQVRGRGGGCGRQRMDALPGCVHGGDMWQLMRASHSTLLGCGAGARP